MLHIVVNMHCQNQNLECKANLVDVCECDISTSEDQSLGQLVNSDLPQEESEDISHTADIFISCDRHFSDRGQSFCFITQSP